MPRVARLARRSRAFVSCATHTLYVPGLTSGMTVVDVGANHGLFRQELAVRVPGARFFGVEANPQLASGLVGYDRVFGCAVTGGEQTVTLHVAENDGASSVLELPEESIVGAILVGTVAVPGRTLEAILREIPGPLDVVKLDIEGAECVALQSLSRSTMARIGQLTVEFHRHEMFGFDLEAATIDALGHMQDNGFMALHFDTVAMDVVLLNRARFGLATRAWRALASLEASVSRLRNAWRRYRYWK